MLVALFLVLAVSIDRSAAKDDFVAAPTTLGAGQAGVLLLQDGGVLTGEISQTADWYVVGHAGGQMQIATSRVQFVGHSLADAYQYRCQHLSGNTLDGHLGLADWCLRYNLLDEATKELNAARSLGPDHPRLALLDRRLSTAKERPAQSATVAAQKSNPTTVATAGAAPATRPDVSNNVVELFTRKVQPVLVNNCTVAKCHQPGGAQAFQLNRAVLRGEANRRTTMQNLAATLALIDREHPETSPLLTVPRQTHGGMTAPIFGARQEPALKHLADWIALVAPTNPADNEAASSDAQSSPALPTEVHSQKIKAAMAKRPRTIPRQPTLQAVEGDAPENENSGQPINDPNVEPAAAIDETQLKTLRSPHRLKYGVTAEKWEPRDAFDPDIFNRQQQSPATSPPKQRTGNPATTDAN
jgi:hypothetical protein